MSKYFSLQGELVEYKSFYVVPRIGIQCRCCKESFLLSGDPIFLEKASDLMTTDIEESLLEPMETLGWHAGICPNCMNNGHGMELLEKEAKDEYDDENTYEN